MFSFLGWLKGVEIFNEDFEVLESMIRNLKGWLKYFKDIFFVFVVFGVILEYNLFFNCNIIFNIKVIRYRLLLWFRSEI